MIGLSTIAVESHTWISKYSIQAEYLEEQEVAIDALPESINSTLQQDFSSFQIEDAEKFEQDGSTYYQLEFEDNSGERNEVFTADGQLTEIATFWD